MSNESNSAVPPLPVTLIEGDNLPAPPGLDDHGFDPNEFEWRPVARRPRADGWKPEVQQAFIDALANSGMVESAARAVDMSVQSAYRLRRAPGAESFARAWDAALDHAGQRLIDVAFQRAIEGSDVPIFDRDGCRIGARWVYNDRLLMFLLRAYRPDRFRHAHEGIRRPGETPPPVERPLAEAVARLAPVMPDAPQLSMDRDRMDYAIDAARGMADFHELYPADERERFRFKPVEADHPASHARRAERMARAAAGRDRAERPRSRPLASTAMDRVLASLLPNLPAD